MKWKLINTAVFAILILSMVGCTTTIVFEDEYDVRIVNRTGDAVKVRFDDSSYRYVDDDEVLIISSVDFGYHEITWEWVSSGGRKKYKEVYEFKIDADFEIVLRDDPDDSIIIIEYQLTSASFYVILDGVKIPQV